MDSMESEKTPHALEMMIKLTEVKLLGGSQHRIHDILYTDKLNPKYMNAKKFSYLKNPILNFLNFLSS